MNASLCRDASERLAGVGLTLETLLDASEGVAFFGSRAAGCAGDESDLDILCVGRGRRVMTKRLDLLWIAPEVFRSNAWLESELAGHVAAHGIWIKPATQHRPLLGSASSIAHKRSVIAGAYEATLRRWEDLSPRSRLKHLTAILRNTQRLEILLRGLPVPPTPDLAAVLPAPATQDELFGEVQARMAAGRARNS